MFTVELTVGTLLSVKVRQLSCLLPFPREKNETLPWQLSPVYSVSFEGKTRCIGKCIHSLVAKPSKIDKKLQTLVVLSVILELKEKPQGLKLRRCQSIGLPKRLNNS